MSLGKDPTSLVQEMKWILCYGYRSLPFAFVIPHFRQGYIGVSRAQKHHLKWLGKTVQHC